MQECFRFIQKDQRELGRQQIQQYVRKITHSIALRFD